MPDTKLNKQFIRLFIAYNRICIQTKLKIKMIRKQNHIANSIFLFFENIWMYIVLFLTYITRNKIDPSNSPWICSCKYLPAGNGMTALTVDYYVEFSADELEKVKKMIGAASSSSRDNEMCDDILRTKFSQAKLNIMKRENIFTKKLVSRIFRDPRFSGETDAKHLGLPSGSGLPSGLSAPLGECRTSEDGLIIGHLCPSTTIVRLVENVDTYAIINNIHSSSVRLLEVEYVCGELPPIQIEIPKSHYIAGNELLSNAYVLRYLEHLPIYANWIYSEQDYILRIVDDNSTIFSINNKQHILLEKDEYKIIFRSLQNNSTT